MSGTVVDALLYILSVLSEVVNNHCLRETISLWQSLEPGALRASETVCFFYSALLMVLGSASF